MKNVIKICTLFLFTLLMNACDKEQQVEPLINESNTSLNDKQKWNPLGGVWSCEHISDYQIYMKKCLKNTPYREALNLAIAEYNAIPNTCLNMSITNDESTADVVIDCTDSQDCYFGSTPPPYEDNQVLIKLNASLSLSACGCGSPMTACDYTYVLLRELGYSLGFTNDDAGFVINIDGELVPNYNFVPGTPLNDPSSIFQSTEAILNGDVDYAICDLPCNLSANDILAVETMYPVCPPPQQVGYSVEFDPCQSLIYIRALNTSNIDEYSWNFNFDGLQNTPIVAYLGPNDQLAVLRVLYNEGEEFCFEITAENCLGSRSTPCEVCFITPDCGNKGDGPANAIGVPSNKCSSVQPCPEGYECNEGICCPIRPGDECVDDSNCPIGYRCVNGNCVQ